MYMRSQKLRLRLLHFCDNYSLRKWQRVKKWQHVSGTKHHMDTNNYDGMNYTYNLIVLVHLLVLTTCWGTSRPDISDQTCPRVISHQNVARVTGVSGHWIVCCTRNWYCSIVRVSQTTTVNICSWESCVLFRAVSITSHIIWTFCSSWKYGHVYVLNWQWRSKNWWGFSETTLLRRSHTENHTYSFPFLVESVHVQICVVVPRVLHFSAFIRIS